MPCHGFLFSLPRCGTEYVRTARHSRLIPCSTLSHCSIPRTPLRLPCSPAEVSVSPGASRQPANAAPCRECRSYFPFFYYDSSFHLHQSPATYLSAGKYFSAKLSPHHLYRCSGCFVSLHTDIPFRQIKTAGIFVVKVHNLPRGIYLHRNLLFLLCYRPARNHL